MANKKTGKITFISQTYQVATAKGSFNKRELWIAPMYFDRDTGEPTAVADEFSISFELTHERCALLDNYNVGDTIVVTFDPRGRVFEKDGRKGCISTLDVRGIDPFGKTQNAGGQVVSETESPAPVQQAYEQPVQQGQQTGLPF